MNVSLLISKDDCSSLDSKDQIMTEVRCFYYSNNKLFPAVMDWWGGGGRGFRGLYKKINEYMAE